MTATVSDRIRAYSLVHGEAGCWVWQRRIGPEGYGYVRAHGRWMLAHRASYEAFVGPIPAGLTIDHLCKNKACVNPAHLEPVTNRENILRSDGITARAARKTHCPSGHPYNGTNTYRDRRGWRGCRACHREAERQRRARTP